MEIITLIENEVSQGNPDLKAEAGLSLLIKTAGKSILFDTGSSGAFADNAEKLGIDLKAVDFVVISHAHFDHTGGLERFFKINSTAKVYIKEEAKGQYFYKIFFLKKYIGVNQEVFQKYTDRFVFVKEGFQIDEHIQIVTQISNHHKQPSDSKHLVSKKDNRLVADDFAHEQMLLISEGKNIYCFTGCSHHGILNMVESAQQLTGAKKMSVIGGFHMYNPLTKGISEKKEDVIKTAQSLNANQQIDEIATGHCTGTGAFKILKSVLGEKLVKLNTGNRITI